MGVWTSKKGNNLGKIEKDKYQHRETFWIIHNIPYIYFANKTKHAMCNETLDVLICIAPKKESQVKVQKYIPQTNIHV